MKIFWLITLLEQVIYLCKTHNSAAQFKVFRDYPRAGKRVARGIPLKGLAFADTKHRQQ